jgi:hypothetical protein
MDAERILAMTQEEFEFFFPGCYRWNEPPKFKAGDLVLSKCHYGEERTVHRVTGHSPPSMIDPKGWTCFCEAASAPGWKAGEWTCGWEGYFELLEVAELEKAFKLTVKPKRLEPPFRRLLKWLLKVTEG